MTTFPAASPCPAALAFDSIAEQYDDVFTDSLIGRAQRDAVWEVLRETFGAGERVLELNCGTGEDALFLARMGVSVYACDASARMIAVAARRLANASRAAQVELEVRATEEISELRQPGKFDGVLSNFSGLNCVADVQKIAGQLANVTKPGGRLVLCLSSRFCVWETLWYAAHGDLGRAARRWKGRAVASLGEAAICVRYPTMAGICRTLRPHFRLRGCKGIGVAVPPSYVEHLARRHRQMLTRLQALDRVISSWPILREIGDHTLIILERMT